MPVDFGAMVLAPCLDVFAREAWFTPLQSQPGIAEYVGRGVYTSRPVDIQVGEDAIVSNMTTKLGIRLADFAVPPIQGDLVRLPAYGTQAAEGPFKIEDTDDDGQGGCDLTLTKIRA